MDCRSMMAIDVGRTRRALSLDVEPLGDGAFRVRGGAAEHVVEHDGDGWRCDCPDSQFNGGVCKHRVARYLHDRLDSRVRDALAAAVGAL